ncbi:MAG: caspase family protein, partial [Ignavibacteria bacterium]|nr:caspase family protein [Ignavibacteria bacterium]
YNPEPVRDVKGFNNIKMFPEIDVQPPSENNSKLTINLKNRGGGIGKVVVLINGKEITGDAREPSFDPNAESLTIDNIEIKNHLYIKPGKENVITVKAFNSEGNLSSRGVDLIYEAPGISEEQSAELWAIVIGISDYEGDKIDLKYASKDAEDFSNALRIGSERLFGEERTHIKLLTTTQSDNTELPTKENIVKAFEMLNSAKPEDILIVYLSGHGVSTGSDDNEDYYYLTREARTGDLKDPVIRKMTSVSINELTELIKKIPALKQVLILDVCGSGRLVDKLTEKKDIPSSQIRAFERMKDRIGLNILTGCAADAVSYEATRFAQGLLTYSILMGIKGAALREGEYIDVQKLFQYSADQVPKLAEDIGGIQQPRIFGGESFDIGRILSEDKVNIPLSSAKPLILQTRFQDANKFIDHLGLEKKVNDLFREVSTKGKDASVVFVDAGEFPDAYLLVGQYKIEDNTVNVNVKLFKQGNEEGSFTVEGDISDINGLVKTILINTEKVVEGK